ncbi:MAG TPA: ABC transporter permease [Candidatus Limnocylindrales bacterium]
MLRIRPLPVRSGRPEDGPIVNRWALLALPVVLFLVLGFLLPLIAIGQRSVTDLPASADGSVIANFQRFFAGEANRRVLGNTFWIAGLSTIVCLAIGYPYAYLMHVVRPRIAGLLLIAVLIPFWSSLLVRTYAWQVILRDTGIVNRSLLDLGVIDEPVTLLRTTFSVLLGMSQILLPFMVLPVYSVMRRIDPEYTRAAANLGAPPFAAFLRVFLPLSLPGVIAGSLLVFVLALGFYITPALLGSPRDTMISEFIVTTVTTGSLDWGLGSAMALVLMALTLAVLFVASRFIRLRDVFGALDAE